MLSTLPSRSLPHGETQVYFNFYEVFFEKFPGRPALLEYAALKGIPVFQTASKPWSTDENLYHISYEAGILEDPSVCPPRDMWKLTADPEDAPNTPERIVFSFKLDHHVQERHPCLCL